MPDILTNEWLAAWQSPCNPEEAGGAEGGLKCPEPSSSAFWLRAVLAHAVSSSHR
jgi:hypothetical protein